MTLTPLATLMPHVFPTEDFLRYRVASRSRKCQHVVDMEARHGLGLCSCEAATLGGERDCWHVREVRKYQSIEVNQGAIQRRQNTK